MDGSCCGHLLHCCEKSGFCQRDTSMRRRRDGILVRPCLIWATTSVTPRVFNWLASIEGWGFGGPFALWSLCVITYMVEGLGDGLWVSSALEANALVCWFPVDGRCRTACGCWKSRSGSIVWPCISFGKLTIGDEVYQTQTVAKYATYFVRMLNPFQNKKTLD